MFHPFRSTRRKFGKFFVLKSNNGTKREKKWNENSIFPFSLYRINFPKKRAINRRRETRQPRKALTTVYNYSSLLARTLRTFKSLLWILTIFALAVWISLCLSLASHFSGENSRKLVSKHQRRSNSVYSLPRRLISKSWSFLQTFLFRYPLSYSVEDELRKNRDRFEIRLNISIIVDDIRRFFICSTNICERFRGLLNSNYAVQIFGRNCALFHLFLLGVMYFHRCLSGVGM